MKQTKIYTKEEMKKEIENLENYENYLCDISVALDFLNNNGDVKNYKQAICEARTLLRNKQQDFKKYLQEDNDNNIVIINIETITYKEGSN